jgi:hypothetical protein
MAEPSTDVIQGTLDLLILKTLSLEPMHGFGIGRRVEQMSRGVFKVNHRLPAHRAQPARTGRMARCGVAADGELAPGEILSSHPRRKKAARDPDRRLDPPCIRDCAPAEG